MSKSVRHHGLSLSEGNRKATLTEPLSSDDNLIVGTFVLVGQPVTGHCYWEVEWSGLSVGLGVFNNLEIDRFSQFKSFFMQCYGHGKCVFTNKLPTVVYRGHVSSRIGVYLDHSAGTLSYYNVNVKSGVMNLLHRVEGSMGPKKRI